LVEYDHLLNAKKIEDDVKIEDILNENSKATTEAWGDPAIKNLSPKDLIQFERRGYYIVDRVRVSPDGKVVHEMIYVPDGKSKAMGIAGKVNKLDCLETDVLGRC
jgi:glutamyl-tRNA synthetase